MRMIALVQAVGGPTGPAGRRCRGCTCRLRLCRWGSTRQRGVAPADPRRAAGGGGLRAHTSGRAATRAIGHGDPLGRRCRRRRVPPPGVAPPSAASALSGASCRPRRARSLQAVLQVWVGGVCSGAPRVAPSRGVRRTRSAARAAPTRLLVRDRLSDVGAVPERCSLAPPVVSVSASTWFLRVPSAAACDSMMVVFITTAYCILCLAAASTCRGAKREAAVSEG